MKAQAQGLGHLTMPRTAETFEISRFSRSELGIAGSGFRV